MSFIPRFNSNGIRGNPKWYDQNPFYLAGYGMPNCTCYAWGRFWEISDPNNEMINRPNLPTGNAGTWFATAQSMGIYETGNIPKLGAIICFSDIRGGAGHVAVVEEIKSNGDLVTSNSGWRSSYFWLSNVPYQNGSYNKGNYNFQGFIYNPDVSPSPSPTPPIPRIGVNKWAFLTNKKINIFYKK